MADDHILTTEQALGDEIARVRHGQDVTASDLANRLMRWLAEHDAALIEELADEVNVKRNEPGLVHLDVRYAGYYTGIRSGLESSETLLREKARQRRDERA